jgi:protein gp37
MVRTFFERTMALERKAVRIGRPLFVFPSMCDPFYTPVEWLPVDWAETAERTPHLIWLLLTKRPSRIPDGITWPKNAWLGVSAENQEWADKRVPILLQKQCTVRFVSNEPALGPVDLRRGIYETDAGPRGTTLDGIHWVICGGESGAGARKMEMPWAMNLASQCEALG